MSDDLVIQLKALAGSMKRGEGRSTVYGAVSEIEYLRAELEELQIDRDSWFNAYRLLCDLKAVRGD